MSVSTSFGVEQQPVEASEAEELSTLAKTRVRPLSTSTPSLADPSEYKRRARLNPYLFKIFPNQWIPILPNGNCGEYLFRGCYESPELPAPRNACLN